VSITRDFDMPPLILRSILDQGGERINRHESSGQLLMEQGRPRAWVNLEVFCKKIRSTAKEGWRGL
jgi:hypothetical protein